MPRYFELAVKFPHPVSIKYLAFPRHTPDVLSYPTPTPAIPSCLHIPVVFGMIRDRKCRVRLIL